MSTEANTQHSQDDRQESLRETLLRLRKYVSVPAMILACKDAGYGEPVEDRALRNFLGDKEYYLQKKNFEKLANFWFHSPLGRALRFVDPTFSPKVEELVRILFTGNRMRREVKVDGLYFMYYGSYVEADHYAIRVIEIKSDDGDILTVTDSIRDRLQIQKGIRVSHGALTFFEERPQMLLLPDKYNETKAGFTLMAGIDKGTIDCNTLMESLGVFLTLTQKGLAVRSYLLIRQPSDDPDTMRDTMIAQSGAYSFPELCKKDMVQHRKAFDALAKHLPKTIPDPMLIYGTHGCV